MTDAAELIDLLHRRGDLLATLLDEPAERYELVDRVPASKSTVYKGVSQLKGRGLIERTPRGLEPTLFGVVAHERYREGKGRARRISSALITAMRAAIVTTSTMVLPVTNHAAETSVASTPRASANEESARSSVPIVGHGSLLSVSSGSPNTDVQVRRRPAVTDGDGAVSISIRREFSVPPLLFECSIPFAARAIGHPLAFSDRFVSVPTPPTAGFAATTANYSPVLRTPMTLDRYSVPDVSEGEVVDEEFVVTDDVLVKVFALGSGAELSAHEHDDSTNVFHVTEGTVTVLQDGEEEAVTAPDVVLHERGVTHGARNDSDEVAVLTASLCPPPS
jgi:quercetin dioxygenase-like cupin family protein